MQQEQIVREVTAWLGRRLPDGWFTGPPEVTADGEEILVIGPLADGGEDPVERARRFREETREPRVLLAAELARMGRQDFGSFTVGEVELVRTDRLLSPAGTTTLARLPLAGRPG